jgi:hypothetical protein
MGFSASGSLTSASVRAQDCAMKTLIVLGVILFFGAFYYFLGKFVGFNDSTPPNDERHRL